MVNLSEYAEKILYPEDRPLFDEAVKTGEVGALRATYVMIWLACAESLKRRFNEAQKWDKSAGNIVKEVKRKEDNHESVDRYILIEAKKYGFISDSSYISLQHVYTTRCIYGHPYEEAPSKEEVLNAANVVVEHVLSKPIKLGKDFGEQKLNSLLNEPNLLDNQQSAVEAYAKDILPRLNETHYRWFLEYYWAKLGKIITTSPSLIEQRGIWFSCTMLREFCVDLFTHNDWHDNISNFPKVMIHLCTFPDIFQEIGSFAQDMLVAEILSESKTRASVLASLEKLKNNNLLTPRQRELFEGHILQMDISAIRFAGLSTLICYEKLIDTMKSLNFYLQNPAIDLIFSNGPDQVAKLNDKQQVILGRNILQCAEGGAISGVNFLEKLPEEGVSWPFDMLRGIALEVFTNERNQIRFKFLRYNYVFSIINLLEPKQRDLIISQIIKSIKVGTPKSSFIRERFDDVINKLANYPWAKPLVESLTKKADSLEALQ